MHETLPRVHFLTLLLLLSVFQICLGVSILGIDSVRSGELEAMGGTACAGMVGERSALGDELMDSESSRRGLLMKPRSISYGTLGRDLVPCDRPGASYYNCNGPGIANSYNRGCEKITRCWKGG